jgi:hypothetical protein
MGENIKNARRYLNFDLNLNIFSLFYYSLPLRETGGLGVSPLTEEFDWFFGKETYQKERDSRGGNISNYFQHWILNNKY